MNSFFLTILIFLNLEKLFSAMFKYAIEGNEVTEQEFCMMLNKPHDLVIDDKNYKYL